MEKPENSDFAAAVGRRLANEGEAIRSLWVPLAQEFQRMGPDGARSFLEAQLENLQDRVQRLREQVEDQ